MSSTSRQPAKARTALLLANTNARQVREWLPTAVKRLSAAGIETIEACPEDAAQIQQLVREHRAGIDLVIVAGGDGTLNRVVDALVDAQLPLAVLPLGTANDLARTLGIPCDIPLACQVIADAHTRHIDLGWVNGKHYFNVASLGVSVSITRQLDSALKKRWGIFAYVMTAIRALWRCRLFRAEIIQGDVVHSVKTVQISVGNGRFYGGGMAVAEDAAIDDQQLDLYSIEVEHRWQIPLLFFALRSGRLAAMQHARTLVGRSFEIRTRKPRAINTDGEITTQTPATFRLVPRALEVYTPRPAK